MTAKFAKAVWVYENVVADSWLRGGVEGTRRVRRQLNLLTRFRIYGAAQDLLARALVQATGAIATGGTSVLTSAPGLSYRLLQANLVNLYQVQLSEADFGLQEALKLYQRLDERTKGMSTAGIDVAKAEDAFDAYAQAFVFESGYSQRLKALLPKSGRELVVKAVNSATNEVLAVVAPGTDEMVTWETINTVRATIQEALAPVAGMVEEAAIVGGARRSIEGAKDLIASGALEAAQGCN